MKKNFAIYSRDDESWAGGLYYKRNVLYMLLNNKNITDRYNILLFSYKEYDNYFKQVKGKYRIIHLRKHKHNIFNVVENIIKGKKYKVEYLYSYNRDINRFGIKSIAWIPDFQDKKYPQYFSEEEIRDRDNKCNYIAQEHIPVTLSSNACKIDYNSYYNSQDAIVMPFVSYILPELELGCKSDHEILTTYNLQNQKYIIICNQFWKHKNHIVALKAFEIFLSETGRKDYKLVLTGKLSDYRNPNYIENIKQIISKYQQNRLIVSLGFVPRYDQLILMKHAEYLIQPSLSEGWGTVVEDAKVLDKTILLSDIPVHHEQMNEKCKLFNPNDPQKLAKMIADECNVKHYDNVDFGIANMKKNALIYTSELEKFLLKNY